MRHHLIRKLQQKKHRDETGLFLVEGETSVLEALRAGPASRFRPDYLAASEDFLADHGALIRGITHDAATADQLARAGTLKTNNAAILVMRRPAVDLGALDLLSLAGEAGAWLLALDGINDPGNLGALVRVADWYGLAGILASPDTVELYNPKVIAASKGSFLRVPVAVCDLAQDLTHAIDHRLVVYAAMLEGTSLRVLSKTRPGILVMGSETHGVSAAILGGNFPCHRFAIPRYGAAESLNVAVAAGIMLDNLRRISL